MRPKGIRKLDWVLYNGFMLLEHVVGVRFFDAYFLSTKMRLQQRMDSYLKSLKRGGLLDTALLEQNAPFKNIDEVLSKPDNPMVFRQAAKNWNCVKKWNVEYFEEHYGDKEVLINDTVGFTDHKAPQSFAKVKLRDYLSEMRKGSKKYLKFNRLVHHNRGLQFDFDLDWLKKFQLPWSFNEAYYLFIGGQNTLTPVHNGFVCTVFIQIYGRKKWTIYKVGERVFLDVRADRRMYFYSSADPDNINDERFPLLKYAEKYEVILEPGDVLWIPPLVWHQVENLSESIGVAFKFPNIPMAFRTSKVLTSLFFLATKPNIFKALWVSLTHDEDYVFTKEDSEITR